MNTLLTVWLKELREFFRDRRTMMIALVYGPLLMPALMIGMMTMGENRARSQADKPLDIAIVGAEHAPNLVAWLAGRGINRKDIADPDAAIRSQEADAYLRIGDDFAGKWRAGRPALVEVVYDSSRRDSAIPVSRIEAALASYSSSAGSLRLLARGVSPGVVVPLAVSRKDLATAEARRGMVMAMLPYLFILSAFLGGAHLIIDATAGERERQSLEPLLATPASRSAIVSGKMLAAACIGLASLLLTLLALKVGASMTSGIARALDVSLPTIAQALVILLPMLLIGTGILTWLAAGAKSVKEAQSYMTILMLLPMVPTIMLMVNPVREQMWQFAVPFLAQNQMLLKLFRGEAIGAQQWLVYMASGFALVLLLWLLARHRYQQERLAVAS